MEIGVTLPQQWEEGLPQQSNQHKADMPLNATHSKQTHTDCMLRWWVGLHIGCTRQQRRKSSICNRETESPFHKSGRKGFPAEQYDCLLGRRVCLHIGCTWQQRKSICTGEMELTLHNSGRWEEGLPQQTITLQTHILLYATTANRPSHWLHKTTEEKHLQWRNGVTLPQQWGRKKGYPSRAIDDVYTLKHTKMTKAHYKTHKHKPHKL